MSQCYLCDMEIEFDNTRTNQKGGVFPIEKKTGNIHNCSLKISEGCKKIKQVAQLERKIFDENEVTLLFFRYQTIMSRVNQEKF